MKRLFLFLALFAMPTVLLAQSVGTYVETPTGNTKAAVGVTLVQGSNASTVQSPTTDTVAAATGITTTNQNLVFNGTTWARQRGDANGTVVIPAFPSTWWRYVPPVGGLTNTTTGQVVRAAAGAGVSNYIYGGECYSDPLGAATEIELRDGAAGAAMWRMKIPTSGWTVAIDINFNPPIRGTANTLVEMATTTASVTGSVYCNWRGATGG